MPITVQHQPSYSLLGSAALDTGQRQYQERRRQEEAQRQLALMQMAQRERMQANELAARQQSQQFGAMNDWGRMIFGAQQSQQQRAQQHQNNLGYLEAQYGHIGERDEVNQRMALEKAQRAADMQRSMTTEQNWSRLIGDPQAIAQLTSKGQGDLAAIQGEWQKVTNNDKFRGAPEEYKTQAWNNFVRDRIQPFMATLPANTVPEDRTPFGKRPVAPGYYIQNDGEGNPIGTFADFGNLDPAEWVMAHTRPFRDKSGKLQGWVIPELEGNLVKSHRYEQVKQTSPEEQQYKRAQTVKLTNDMIGADIDRRTKVYELQMEARNNFIKAAPYKEGSEKKDLTGAPPMPEPLPSYEEMRSHAERMVGLDRAKEAQIEDHEQPENGRRSLAPPAPGTAQGGGMAALGAQSLAPARTPAQAEAPLVPPPGLDVIESFTKMPDAQANFQPATRSQLMAFINATPDQRKHMDTEHLRSVIGSQMRSMLKAKEAGGKVDQFMMQFYIRMVQELSEAK